MERRAPRPVELLNRPIVQHLPVDREFVDLPIERHGLVLIDPPVAAIDLPREGNLRRLDGIGRALWAGRAGLRRAEDPAADVVVVVIARGPTSRPAIILPHPDGKHILEGHLGVEVVGIDIAIIVRVVIALHRLVEDLHAVGSHAQLRILHGDPFRMVGYVHAVEGYRAPASGAAYGQPLRIAWYIREEARVLIHKPAVDVELHRALVERQGHVVPGVGGEGVPALPVAAPVTPGAESKAQTMLHHAATCIPHVHSLQRRIASRLATLVSQDALWLPQLAAVLVVLMELKALVVGIGSRIDPGAEREAAVAQVEAGVRADIEELSPVEIACLPHDTCAGSGAGRQTG